MSLLKRRVCSLMAFVVITTNMPIMAMNNLPFRIPNISQRVTTYKDIIEVEVYSKTGEKVVLETELNTSNLNISNYLVRVDMKDIADFYTTINKYEVRDGKLYLTLNDPNIKNRTLEVEFGKVSGGIATSNGKVEVANGGFLGTLSSLTGYNADYEIAYSNVYKLMPYYDGEHIIEDGNTIPLDSKLATVKIKSILPLDENGDLVKYLTNEKADRVSSIKIVYEDNEIENYDVTYQSSKDNIANYVVSGMGLVYSFDRYLISENDKAVTQLTQHIENTDYSTYLGLMSLNVKDNRSLRDYYQVVQDDAQGVALEILSNVDDLVPTVDSAIYDLMLDNSMKTGEAAKNTLMLKVLYAYNYYQRFYSYDIADIDIADLILFKGDELFNDKVALQSLAEAISKTNPGLRGGKETANFYNNQLGPHTGKKNLVEFNDYLIKLLTDYEDPRDWFTDRFNQTCVFKEVKSDRFVYRLWDNLKKKQHYILPLMTLPDDSYYLVSLPGQIMIGSPKVYHLDITNNQASRDALKKAIDNFAVPAGRYMDTIGGFINDDARINNLMILSIDKREILQPEGWRHQYLEGEVNGDPHPLSEDPFMKGFTEVVGVWARNNGSAAMGGNETIRWMAYSAFSGFDVWSHETGHNIDSRLLLKGYQMRGEMEDYTDGIITQFIGDGHLSFNTSQVRSVTENVSNNFSYERINTPEKAQSYYKGLFDTIDLLDYLEAKAFLKLTREEQERIAYFAFYTSNHMTPDDVGNHTYHLYPLGHKFTLPIPISPGWKEELETIEDIYDSRVVLRPGTGNKMEFTVRNYVSDGYQSRWWYQPHFSQGRGDSYTFKNMGFRMLGEAGYDKGFVQYLSYLSQNDLDGLRKATGKDSFKEWKLGRYEEIENKLDQLNYIDADALVEEYYQALKKDAANYDRNVPNASDLRRRNFYFLKRMTDDFVMDIYNDEQEVIPISTFEDLQKIKDRPNGNYELVNDIDVSEATSKSVVDAIFVGKLDGNGHKIYGSELATFTEVKHAYIDDLNVEDSVIGLARTLTSSKLTNVNVEEAAIEIATLDDFIKIAESPSANYKLVADIDFSNYKKTGDNLSVINTTFTGKLDGNGYTLKNLKDSALIYIVKGEIKNLTIQNFTNNGPSWQYLTVLAKKAENAKFSNITIDNSRVNGRQYSGLLIGEDAGSEIKNISIINSTMDSHDWGSNGMLIGKKNKGSIKDVYVDGKMIVRAAPGGSLVGEISNNVTIENVISRATLEVIGTDTSRQIGGLVGKADKSKVSSALFLGSLTGTKAGFNFTGAQDKTQFTNSYEINTAGGVSSVSGQNIQQITQPQLTEDFYKNLGFDENVWSFHTIDAGYPVLLASLEATKPPVITPNGGEIEDKQLVEILTDTEGATIYYTLDGTTPNKNSNVYTSPIEITEDTVVKAISVKDGMAHSIVVEAVFTKEKKHETPNAQIDFVNEKLFNVVDGATYTINGEVYNADDSGSIPIDQTWMNGNEVEIVQVGDDATNSSDAQRLLIPARTTGPSLEVVSESYYGAKDGMILGVDDTMEYRSEHSMNWNTTTGSAITGLSTGGYFVRYKAIDGVSFASEETVINISNGQARLEDIIIRYSPLKTWYYVGEVFDPNGMEIVASYNDGTSRVTNSYTYTPSGELSEYDDMITIAYKEDGVRVTTTQAITVTPLRVEGYYSDEKGTPLKTEFTVGYGTTKEQALSKLSNKAYIKLNNGKSLAVDIEWKFDNIDYDGNVPDTYNVVGTIVSKLPSSIKPKELTGSIRVLADEIEETQYATVVFDNQGHGTKPRNQVVELGLKATEPKELSEKGWIFGGWYLDKECTIEWNFDTDVVNNDMVLYAKWDKVDNDGDSNTDTDTDTDIDDNEDNSIEEDNDSNTGTGTNKEDDDSEDTSDSEGNIVINEDGSKTTTTVDSQTGEITTKIEHTNGIVVDVVNKPDSDLVVKVDLPKDIKEAIIDVPAELDSSLVPIDAKTGEVIKLSMITDKGLTVKVNGSVDMVLVNRDKQFIDTKGHWAEDTIKFVTARDIFYGTSENVFSPNSNMTRKMLIVALSRLDGTELPIGETWYDSSVKWAIENGISDGTNLDDDITREQLISILYRYVGSPEVNTKLDNVKDAQKVSNYSKESMAWAIENKLINGLPDGTIDPQGKATRAQVSAILMRFCEMQLTK